MAESLAPHKLPGGALTAEKPVHISFPQRRKPSRPHYLDWILHHQIEVASALVLSVASLDILYAPSRTYTRKFLNLSYPTQTKDTYRQGPDDLCFVLAWVVNFTALRAVSIEWILQPLAEFFRVAQKNRLRIAEQGWQVMYYGTFWGLGMYLWINSPYWLDNRAIWKTWPAREMSGPFKWYHLVQLAFWFQQILVIHLEKRRKDHNQMLTHHIITCITISVAYVYRYTNVANVVLCLMDIVDLLLPIAKILRYLGQETACNITFGVFVITWFISRHVMFPQLCYDIYKDVPGPDTMLYGCYSGATNELLTDIPAQPDYFSHLFWPFQDLDGVICLNTEVKWLFLGMLGFLQLLSMIWFGMVIKIVAGILMGGNAEDIRSDDEEDEEIDTGIEPEIERKLRPMDVTDLNVCVGGNSANEVEKGPAVLSPKPRPASTRRRLMAAENRKELLGRIGCEKP